MRWDVVKFAAGCLLLLMISSIAIIQPVILQVVDPLSGPWTSTFLAEHPSGSIKIKGLENRVTVIYDSWGVPHIYVDNEADLAMALGYVEAYDRLFQMDLMRRLASGRLSELFGDMAYDSDVFYRIIGLRRAAEATWQEIKSVDEYADVATLIESFTLGINSFIDWAESKGVVPIEYAFVGCKPEYWTPVDVVTIVKLILWDLSGSFEDLALNKFVEQYGVETLINLGILDSPLNTPITKGLETRYKAEYTYNVRGSCSNIVKVPVQLLSWLKESKILSQSLLGEGFSNNWVISGRITSTGYPILANDPHLSLQVPPTWLEIHINAGDLNVGGVTFPGTPLIVIGRNDYIAWGFTNVGGDVVDYYYYKWKDGKYYYGGRWLEPERIDETILVKKDSGFEKRTITVNLTVHGPLVERDNGRFAMKWTGSGVTLEPVAFYYFTRARTVYDFLEAQKYFQAPAQNAVIADVEGNIAYCPAGDYPIREPAPLVYESNGRKIYNTGFLPFNGSRGEGEWSGFIPRDELPRVVNPERGYIVTANNKPVGPEYPYYLGWSWEERYRYERIVQMIEEVLREKGEISVEDVLKMQYDVKSLAALTTVDLIMKAYNKDKSLFNGLKNIVKMLSEWNGDMDPEKAEPTIAYFTILKLNSHVWKEKLEAIGLSESFFGFESTEYILRMAFNGSVEASSWLGEGPEKIVAEALKDAVEECREKLGDDVSQWKWGELHTYAIEHPMGGILSWLNYPAKPAPGDIYTVNRAPRLNVKHGSSMRYVADLSPQETGYIILPGGNSGNPFSKHYYDQLERWIAGPHRKIFMPRDPGKVEAESEVELTPG